MTRQEAITRISELSCAYRHVRMTECPHCAAEVEGLIRMLVKDDNEVVKNDNEVVENE